MLTNPKEKTPIDQANKMSKNKAHEIELIARVKETLDILASRIFYI